MSYPGGKEGSGVYQWLINLMPPHKTYVEAFVGGGAVLRHKLQAPINIAIDADLRVLQALPDMMNVTLVCDNAISYLRKWRCGSEDLVFCDPPYLMELRRNKRPLYRVEFPRAAHVQLLDVITSLDCMVMITGYWSELYAERLSTWNCASHVSTVRSGAQAVEYCWFNYPVPNVLHDFRYLGANYRERERIKRRVNRWKGRLARMDELERRCLVQAIADTTH